MIESSTYFDGRVTHWILPTYHQPTGPEAPLLKRLLLPQGELAQFYDGDDAIHYMALIELKAGGVRGNHYHHRKIEYVYVISGSLDLALQEIPIGRTETVSLKPGQLVRIQTEIAHALKTTEPGLAVEFSPARFDASDTIRHVLIPPAG